MAKKNSSWESVGDWYDRIVGDEGHFYHRELVIPNSLKMLNLKKESRLVDLGCGQGVLARHIPAGVDYLGIDSSKSLVQKAREKRLDPAQRFDVGDVCQLFGENCLFPETSELKGSFTHAAILLALQNMHEGEKALKNCSLLLKQGGHLLLVLNHPCFRIPRQSHWSWKEEKKLQAREIERYMSPMEIPIQTHPGKGEEATVSYHRPLSSYFSWLAESGFATILLEEWCSPKASQGAKADAENRARAEFPLFLALLARKIVR